MYDSILIPFDGSGRGETAVSLGLELAQALDVPVTVLSVVPAGAEPAGLDREQADELRAVSTEHRQEATARVVDRATELGLDATHSVREGAVYRTILDHADEHDTDLIVMGTHGRTGPDAVRLGSTAERVISLASMPVLAVPPAKGIGIDGDGVDRIVLATDGSGAADRAAEHGIELAAATEAAVSVVYVVDSTTYDLQDAPRSIIGLLTEGGQNTVAEIAAEARDRGLSVDTSVRRGRPDESVVAFADDRDGALVVMGTSGRGGATDALLGSTVARVLRRTNSPILVVS